jgi:hypothetical protein
MTYCKSNQVHATMRNSFCNCWSTIRYFSFYCCTHLIWFYQMFLLKNFKLLLKNTLKCFQIFCQNCVYHCTWLLLKFQFKFFSLLWTFKFFSNHSLYFKFYFIYLLWTLQIMSAFLMLSIGNLRKPLHPRDPGDFGLVNGTTVMHRNDRGCGSQFPP